MFKRLPYIIVSVMLLFSFTQAMAQIAMPDTVCIGTTRTYRVNDASTPSTYIWIIDGVVQTSTRNDITTTWNKIGTFLITVQEHSANGCEGDIRSGLVYVMPLPVANAGPDAVMCFGNTIRLNGSGGSVYQWSPPIYLSGTGIANPLMTPRQPGTFTYYLNVTNAFGCRSLKSDTVTITVLPPVKVFAGNDTSVAVNQPFQLNATDIGNSGFTNYSWSPSFGLNNAIIKNPIATIGTSSIYTYIVTAKTAAGCEASDDIIIKVFVSSDIYVPNAFTPNNDKLNDVFRPVLIGMKTLKYFAVYNRWGQLVFSTKEINKGWDGTLNGKPQDPGTFVWIAEAVDFKNNTVTKKGTVTMIR
jgi:gliding motility-associated-like protein